MRIFYKDKIEDIIEIDSSRFHKITSVLRMNIGDNIEIFDGKGNSYNSEIIAISKKTLKLKLEIDNPIKMLDTSPIIHLAFSIIKPSRFEIAVEKTTELGLHSILPIVTENTNNTYVKMFTKSRLQRIESISISAAEQCGTNYVPNYRKSYENFKFIGIIQ
ncbi:MAG: 16S rRNA (uracil(1498)-N(3))-methyltransferase [Dehalococcoidia bacterium]